MVSSPSLQTVKGSSDPRAHVPVNSLSCEYDSPLWHGKIAIHIRGMANSKDAVFKGKKRFMQVVWQVGWPLHQCTRWVQLHPSERRCHAGLTTWELPHPPAVRCAGSRNPPSMPWWHLFLENWLRVRARVEQPPHIWLPAGSLPCAMMGPSLSAAVLVYRQLGLARKGRPQGLAGGGIRRGSPFVLGVSAGRAPRPWCLRYWGGCVGRAFAAAGCTEADLASCDDTWEGVWS